MDKPQTEIIQEHSAGGIVYKMENQQIMIAVIYREYHHDWTLAKGHLEPGETTEQAALREVMEECGLRCELKDYVGYSVFRFRNKHKQLIEKKVDYYLMKLLEDTHKVQTEEVDEVVWLPFLDAIKQLSFKRDQNLVKQAVGKIKL
jgi:8-oxo-dGTP pyrophosphatase MutT (NUDIX family)